MNTTQFRIWILLIIICFSNYYGQDNPDKKELENILSINSHPGGTMVYVDTSFVGMVPVELKNFKTGKHKVVLRLNNEVVFDSIIVYNGGLKRIYPILNGEYALIDFLSMQDSVKITIDNSFLGVTPLKDVKVELGFHNVKFEKKDYATIDQKLYFSKEKREILRTLEYNYAFITLPNDEDNYALYIDDSKVPDSERFNFRLTKGEHKFEIRYNNSDRLVSRMLSVFPDSVNQLKYYPDVFTTKNFLISSIIPGYGQILDGSPVKGAAFIIGIIASGAYFYQTISAYNEKLDSYNSAYNLYLDSKNEMYAIENRLQLKSALDEVNKAADNKNLALTLLIGCYVLNVLDALIFHSHQDILEIEFDRNINNSSALYNVNFNIKL